MQILSPVTRPIFARLSGRLEPATCKCYPPPVILIFTLAAGDFDGRGTDVGLCWEYIPKRTFGIAEGSEGRTTGPDREKGFPSGPIDAFMSHCASAAPLKGELGAKSSHRVKFEAGEFAVLLDVVAVVNLVWGLGCGVKDVGFRDWNLNFKVFGLGCGIQGLGFRVSGLGFRASSFEFRVAGFGFRVLSLRFGVWGLRFGV